MSVLNAFPKLNFAEIYRQPLVHGSGNIEREIFGVHGHINRSRICHGTDLCFEGIIVSLNRVFKHHECGVGIPVSKDPSILVVIRTISVASATHVPTHVDIKRGKGCTLSNEDSGL